MSVSASSGMEPISPELVLVDPKLRRSARAALPARPWEAVAPPPRWVPPPAPAERPVAEAPATLPSAERARLWPRRAATAAVSLAGIAAFVAASAGAFTDPDDRPYLAPLEDESAPPAETIAPSAPPATFAPRTPVQLPKAESKSKAAPAKPAAQPSARARSTTPAARARSRSRNAPEGRPPTGRASGFGQGRIFTWPRYTGATYYHVTLTRAGKVLYEARPAGPQLLLPARLRLRPGKYMWVVRAGYGVRSERRLGPPFLRSRFQVRRG
jgi:hypothetical protein